MPQSKVDVGAGKDKILSSIPCEFVMSMCRFRNRKSESGRINLSKDLIANNVGWNDP